MNLIYLLLRTSWLTVVLAVLTGLLSGASSTGLVALTNTALTNNSRWSEQQLLISFIVLCFTLLITNFCSQILLARLSQSAVFDLRIYLSRRILASPLRRLEEIGIASLLATLTDDVQSVSLILSRLPFICTNLAIVVSCLIYLSWLSLAVFWLMLVVLIVAVVSSELLIAKGQKMFSLAREEQDKLFQHFRTITEGIKELKLHQPRQEAFFNQDLVTTANASRRYTIKAFTTFSIASSWGLMNLFIALGIIVFLVPNLVETTPEILSGYALVTIYLILPLNAVINALPDFSKAAIALAKIDSLGLSLAAETKEKEVSNLASPQNSWQHLQLTNTAHNYHNEKEDSRFTLGSINLTIKAGELVFIVGGNGSGKSTLAKLITGLYSPESGVIYLDKQPIGDHNRGWYRQHFAVVFADFYLFERLVGLEQPEFEKQAQKFLKTLQLEHKVKINSGKLSTTALSQGQRKRLALLNAYLEDRPIYLFDEWASDQDPLFREIFYTQLLQELKNRGKTLLVISHDDHYFHLADRIIKLDYGQVEYDNYQR
ncbi:MAG: cyclic peptide export ABC transporter [Spirulinaceae cyanobacterium]